jgi:hypothetical protein
MPVLPDNFSKLTVPFKRRDPASEFSDFLFKFPQGPNYYVKVPVDLLRLA